MSSISSSSKEFIIIAGIAIYLFLSPNVQGLILSNADRYESFVINMRNLDFTKYLGDLWFLGAIKREIKKPAFGTFG